MAEIIEATHEVDQEDIDQGVLEAYVRAGYVSGEAEDPQKDEAALTEAVYTATRSAVVSSREERSLNALTRGGLCSRVFPMVPGAEPGSTDSLTELQREVWEALCRTVWNRTNPNHTGTIQKLLTVRDPSYILVRAKVVPAHEPVDGVYVTEDVDLILSDFCLPLKEKVRLVSDKLAKNLAMVSERKPELKATMSKELDSGMKAATSLAKSTLELTTGSQE